MSQYVYAWITVAVLATLSELMISGGQQGKTAGHLRFVAGLCVLVAMLPAVKAGIYRLYEIADGAYEIQLPGGEDGENDYNGYFSENILSITREQYEVWIYDALEREFALSDGRVVAVVHMQETGGVPALAAVDICLMGTGILKNPHEIEAYVERQLSVPCTVSVDWG